MSGTKNISARANKRIPLLGPKSGIKNGKISSRAKLKSKIKDLLRSGSFMKLNIRKG